MMALEGATRVPRKTCPVKKSLIGAQFVCQNCIYTTTLREVPDVEVGDGPPLTIPNPVAN